jgi:uncharacterized protein (TIGR02145 family)
MKRLLDIVVIMFLFAGSIAILHSCKKRTVPEVTTAEVSGITQTNAVSGGNVTNNGGAEVTARGVCWNTAQNPTIGSSKTSDGAGNGVFPSNITGLTANTKYYVSAYATNSEGTGYGNEVSFTTNPLLKATLTTSPVTNITSNSAMSGGNITSDGGAQVTARGVCWNTSINPTISNFKTTNGSGIGEFTSSITGLEPDKTYYLKAYATNSVETAYGEEITFSTSGVKDIEGNVYETVKIGDQVWMAENLKTTKYKDGAVITLATRTSWSQNCYGWYEDDASHYKATYGALYSYGSNFNKLCPTGWHVPEDTEWTTLTTYLGGDSIAGGKLKEIGKAWLDPNKGATNLTHFSALPGGWYSNHLDYFFYENEGANGYWWSYTESSTIAAFYRSMSYNSNRVYRGSGMKFCGLSIRCVKDN